MDITDLEIDFVKWWYEKTTKGFQSTRVDNSKTIYSITLSTQEKPCSLFSV